MHVNRFLCNLAEHPPDFSCTSSLLTEAYATTSIIAEGWKKNSQERLNRPAKLQNDTKWQTRGCPKKEQEDLA